MDVKERKWTRVEYERLVEAEILGPEDRVELLGGAMIEKEPQYSPHATAIRLVQQALTEVFGSGWDVRPHMPVSLDEESVPEPDVCVVPGDPRDYRDAHPTRPVLVVEVALSRLGFDRDRKGSLYASRSIAGPCLTAPRSSVGATGAPRPSVPMSAYRRSRSRA